MVYKFTMPILLPVASKFPDGEIASAVVLYAPVSFVRPIHLRIPKSH